MLVAVLLALLASVCGEECEPTLPSALGPVYVPNSPFKSEICPTDGQPPGVWQCSLSHPYLWREMLTNVSSTLRMTGTVRSSGRCKALQGAEVDVWQADASGLYGALNGDRSFCRGVVRTDSEGRYEFTTKQPGAYGTSRALLGGSWWIPDLPPWGPRHLHVVIWHPEHRLGVYQIYFEGDPGREHDWRISMAGDHSLFRAKSSLLTMTGGNTGNGTFDFVLEPLKAGVEPYASRFEAARARCPVEEVGVPALCRPLLALMLRPEVVYAGIVLIVLVFIAAVRLVIKLIRTGPRDRVKRD